ncbi:MAG TPA: FHA domain-containing protein [Rhodanobacteraceae bacterium]|nr:FHA domain-containing protein [Rhodanobacteraceae bacterium]
MHGASDAAIWRVGFIDSDRPDLSSRQRALRVGSSPECEVVLPAASAAARHLTLIHDRRGYLLEVEPSAPHVYVNARPVRERALLRLGDVISVGTSKLLLKQAAEDLGRPRGDAVPPGGPGGLAALRAVAGPLAGQRLPIDDTLVLDGSLLDGCDGRVRLRRGRGAIDFEVLEAGDAARPPRFNGIAAPGGQLRVGDQISWRSHRFLVEAPGIALGEDHLPFVPREEALPEQTAGPANEVWWLIVTAALLALGIALLLLLKL